MLLGLPLLEATDWSKLHHAYGRATDTPRHLMAFWKGDEQARKEAMSHLWSAIIHQGTPWTATGPAALVIVGLLADDQIDLSESLRADLISFLVRVIEAPAQAGLGVAELERLAAFDITPFLESEDDEALYENEDNEDALNSFYARAILGCIQIRPVLMKSMQLELESSDARVRGHAAMGAALLARSDLLRDHAQEIEQRLLSMARGAVDPDERSALVMALGDLGFAPREFLRDPSHAVRMCAALAPSLASDHDAIELLRSTLEHSAGVMDDWFKERPPQFDRRPRFYVVARLVRRVHGFDRLADAAIAVAKVTAKFCVDGDWGPLLASAFADGSGKVRTESQYRYLAALVDNLDLWEPSFGNASLWFKKAGLPYDRDACMRRLMGAE